MPGLVPGIHVLALPAIRQDVDGRDKPGHDDCDLFNTTGKSLFGKTEYDFGFVKASLKNIYVVFEANHFHISFYPAR
jgi:hypothetical protein